MAHKKLIAKVHPAGRRNILFRFKFFCPIDKRWSYITDEKDTKQSFGACEKFAGNRAEVVPAVFDPEKMTVEEI